MLSPSFSFSRALSLAFSLILFFSGRPYILRSVFGCCIEPLSSLINQEKKPTNHTFAFFTLIRRPAVVLLGPRENLFYATNERLRKSKVPRPKKGKPIPYIEQERNENRAPSPGTHTLALAGPATRNSEWRKLNTSKLNTAAFNAPHRK